MRTWVITLASVLAFGVFLTGWAKFGPLDERTAILIRQSRGSIDRGGKLGVHIGDTWSEADRALRRRANIGKPYHRAGWPSEQGPYVPKVDDPVLIGEAEAIYRDTSWQNGVIALRLKDGVVVGIEWTYVGPFYIDT